MSKSDETSGEKGAKDASWELWSQVALMMAGLAAVGWGVVWLRLGSVSVYTHSFMLSTLGILTLPVMFWGLIKAFFNRPIMRTSRTVGFLLLVGVALFCNIPIFAVPLSTEGWQSTHVYRLPFEKPVEGAWVVLAGGDSTATNYHATTATYRWGYDFTVVSKGKRFAGEGENLSDYYCFGESVLAPVGGEVVEVEADHPDHAPQTFDKESILGNHVVIRVEADEYLYVAHLKEKSVPVEVGEQVAAGDVLGACGNSGRTLLPHVHIHLQNSGDFPVAESLPLKFSNYIADGEPVDLGMPLGSSDPKHPLGQRVKNQRAIPAGSPAGESN